MVDRTEEKKEEEKKTEEKKTEAMLPLSPIKRILKEQGVNAISQTGLEEVRLIVQDIIKDMSRNIIVYTRHRKAKISTKEDVLLAIR